MNIDLIAVGRMQRGPVADMFADYQRRLPWPLTVREIDIKKKMPAAARKQEEAERILAELKPHSYVIALDERGKHLTSVDLAGTIGRVRDDGIRTMSVIIGGADGLTDAVRSRADLCLCFGKLTWPHMLIRAMLAEQLYRAWSIDAGHPYHREG